MKASFICVLGLVLLGVTTQLPAADPTPLSFVAQAAINRPVGFQNMFNSEGIAFVPAQYQNAIDGSTSAGTKIFDDL